ncbi:MAG: YfhL family 4Fe-4S dicluster ferredoxin [Methylophilaceae bacterium]|nr:YfhL family 4Fe-4S dicluster ferredoxin [Methylophilaceae bacterium]
MAVMITSACINCGACLPECPNGAISQGIDFYEIDPDRCTECVGHFQESQCQSICPIQRTEQCIVRNPDRIETLDELEAKAKRLAYMKFFLLGD